MKTNGKKGGHSLEATLYRAIRSLGWLLPATEEDVLRSDVDEEGIDLPAELRDPLAALVPRGRAAVSGEESACEETIAAELAQAAREGSGSISEEILEEMRRDREAAERASGRVDD